MFAGRAKLALSRARALGRRSMASLTFETLDVFTTTPFGGNPLAVVHGADGLPTASLQAIAREFNLSETTFVLPPADPSNTARVRIFTPTTELPFAGHPNVGTAYALARRGSVFGRRVGSRLTFEEGAGLVPVTMLADGAAQLEAPMPFSVSAIGQGVSVAAAAACLGLQPADLRSEGRIASLGGNPYVLVELHKSALGRCEPDASAIAATPPGKILAWVDNAPGGTARGDGNGDVDLQSRMFTGRGTEDAATGAANCCLMGLLVTLGRHVPTGADTHLGGCFTRQIAQGVEMGRPSLLIGECEHAGRMPVAVRIAGHCVPIMQGQMDRSLFESTGSA
jgi:trans-2,3-dihydro-3-hydroxyanthranilate isomerase